MTGRLLQITSRLLDQSGRQKGHQTRTAGCCSSWTGRHERVCI